MIKCIEQQYKLWYYTLLTFTFSGLRTTTVPKQSVIHIIHDKISLWWESLRKVVGFKVMFEVASRWDGTMGCR